LPFFHAIKRRRRSKANVVKEEEEEEEEGLFKANAVNEQRPERDRRRKSSRRWK